MEEVKAIESVISSPVGVVSTITLLIATVSWLKNLRKEDKESINKDISEIKNRLTVIETGAKIDLKDHQTNCIVKNDVENLKSLFKNHREDIQRIYNKIEELKDLLIKNLSKDK